METDERDEKLVSRFVAEVGEIFDSKLKESESNFGILIEDVREDMRAWGDQFNTVNSKLDIVIKDVDELKHRVGNLEDETKFIKEYLMDNLEPRVNILESVVVK